MSAALVRGARVRILTGMAGGRIGTVRSVYPGYHGTVVNVEVEIPVLLMNPDGPTHVVSMPYGPDELEVLGTDPAPALADEIDEPGPLPLKKGERITAITTGMLDGARVFRARSLVVSRDQVVERGFIPAGHGVPTLDRIFVMAPIGQRKGSCPELVLQGSIVRQGAAPGGAR